MTLSLRLARGETPGWIYSPTTPGFFFTGGYCCKVPTAKYTVLGGVRQGAIPIANAEQYFEESWSVIAPVPSPARSQGAAATYRGAGLHIGGTFTSPPYFSSQVDRLWQGTWNAETSLPEPRHAHSAVAVDDAVYVVCGRNEQQQTVNTLLEFRDGTWSTKTPEPSLGRAFGNALRTGGGFVSVCGIAGDGQITGDAWRFIASTGTWTSKLMVPLGGRFGAAGFTIAQKSFVVGGNKGFGQILQETIAFVDDGTFLNDAPINAPARYHMAGGSIQSDGFVTGGIQATLLALNRHESLRDSTWTQKTPLLTPARYLTSAVVQ